MKNLFYNHTICTLTSIGIASLLIWLARGQSGFWTFDIASGFAMIFAGYAIYLQKKELALQREEMAMQRDEMQGQKKETKRLADLTKQTAEATRLQVEMEFCKKIECRMVGLVMSGKDGQPYEILFGKFVNYIIKTGIIIEEGLFGDFYDENNVKVKKKSFEFFMTWLADSNHTQQYISLYEQIQTFLPENSQLYEYYLEKESPFTILYEKCKELMK